MPSKKVKKLKVVKKKSLPPRAAAKKVSRRPSRSEAKRNSAPEGRSIPVSRATSHPASQSSSRSRAASSVASHSVSHPAPAVVKKPLLKAEILKPFHSFRHIITWSFIIAAVFGSLAFLSLSSATPQQDSDEKKSSSIFDEKLAQVSTLNLFEDVSAGDDDAVILVGTGNILPARYVEKLMRSFGDYTLPFHAVADFLKAADITFGNLDTPLLNGRNVQKDGMVFRGDPESTAGFLFAGYDMLNLANNQTMGYQVPGLTSTIQALKKAGISFTGAGKNFEAAHTASVVEAKGRRVAFLGYSDPEIPPRIHGFATGQTPGIAAMNVKIMQDDVARALASGADFVVVSMHAGREYAKEATPAQKDFAHAAIDAGASVVFGNHPHVIQPVEKYGNGVIFYSLGNFVFDQFFSEDVQTGLIARVMLEKDKAVEFDFFPVRIENTAPKLFGPEERVKFLQGMGW